MLPLIWFPSAMLRVNSKLAMSGKIAGVALFIMAAGGVWIERTVVETSPYVYLR